MEGPKHGTWSEISREEAVARGLPLFPPFPEPIWERDHWGVRQRIEHLHDWVVYPWESAPLEPGRRYVTFPKSRDPETQARIDARLAEWAANPWRLAHCDTCGSTTTVMDYDPQRGPGDGIPVPEREWLEWALHEYGNPYDDEIISDKPPW